MRDFVFDRAVALAKVPRDPELTAISRKARHPASAPGARSPLDILVCGGHTGQETPAGSGRVRHRFRPAP